MGSHSGQVNEEERWQIIQYVLQLKEELEQETNMNEKYTISKQIKILAISFMLIGLAGIVYGFVSAPSNIEEAKAIVASKSHDSHHGQIMENQIMGNQIMENQIMENQIMENQIMENQKLTMK